MLQGELEDARQRRREAEVACARAWAALGDELEACEAAEHDQQPDGDVATMAAAGETMVFCISFWYTTTDSRIFFC